MQHSLSLELQLAGSKTGVANDGFCGIPIYCGGTVILVGACLYSLSKPSPSNPRSTTSSPTHYLILNESEDPHGHLPLLGIACIGAGDRIRGCRLSMVGTRRTLRRINQPNDRERIFMDSREMRRVRAIVQAEQNMLEEDILDHPLFLQAMADLDVAIICVAPSMEM